MFVWLTSSLFWIYFTPFYTRLVPLFSVANNEKQFMPDISPLMKILNFGKDQKSVIIPSRSSFRLIEDLKYFFYGDAFLTGKYL
jgi:hypothetical protein